MDALDRISDRPGLNRLLILDACRSDPDSQRDAFGPGFQGEATLRNIGAAKRAGYDAGGEGGFQILNSCRPRQYASELPTLKRGLFTEALLQVLQRGNRNPDPLVLDQGLFQQLEKTMQRLALDNGVTSRQSPALVHTGCGLLFRDAQKQATNTNLEVEEAPAREIPKPATTVTDVGSQKKWPYAAGLGALLLAGGGYLLLNQSEPLPELVVEKQPPVIAPESPEREVLPNPRIAQQIKALEQALAGKQHAVAEKALVALQQLAPAHPRLNGFRESLSQLEQQQRTTAESKRLRRENEALKAEQNKRRADDQLWGKAREEESVPAYRHYLENCQLKPCADSAEAQRAIKALEAADQRRYRKATSKQTTAALQATSNSAVTAAAPAKPMHKRA